MHFEKMASPMEIRSAVPADIPDLCILLKELFTQEVEFIPNHEAQERGLKSIISDPAIGQIFVARKDGKTIGMVSVLYTISTALGSRVALLEDMVVSSDVRGIGVGSKLIEYAIDSMKAAGCKRVTLLTDKENKPAQQFYRGHGFLVSTMIPLRLSLV